MPTLTLIFQQETVGWARIHRAHADNGIASSRGQTAYKSLKSPSPPAGEG